jgi:hypothetical protein
MGRGRPGQEALEGLAPEGQPDLGQERGRRTRQGLIELALHEPEGAQTLAGRAGRDEAARQPKIALAPAQFVLDEDAV